MIKNVSFGCLLFFLLCSVASANELDVAIQDFIDQATTRIQQAAEGGVKPIPESAVAVWLYDNYQQMPIENQRDFQARILQSLGKQRFKMANHQYVNRKLNELDISLPDEFNPDIFSELGKSANIDYFAIITLQTVSEKDPVLIKAKLHLLDVQTTEVIPLGDVEGRKIEQLMLSNEEIAALIAKRDRLEEEFRSLEYRDYQDKGKSSLIYGMIYMILGYVTYEIGDNNYDRISVTVRSREEEVAAGDLDREDDVERAKDKRKPWGIIRAVGASVAGGGGLLVSLGGWRLYRLNQKKRQLEETQRQIIRLNVNAQPSTSSISVHYDF